ncbi:MAG TPA: HRDC domain-containing protein [Gemmatimonadales bacterium]|nr:HRDC domain-containing protein [Gemmatimonadales bacterium]
MPIAQPPIIGDPAELARAVSRLAARGRLAMDTEAASFHRYADRVYLLQLSSDDETVLVDPLQVSDLGPISSVLADERVEVVFHDADYDLRVLDRDYGFRARSVFDTRIAAQLLGEPGVGLAALLEKYLGVTLDKKLQRADWSLRPLPPDMVAYAAADTAYLLPLRDLLERRMAALGRLAWAREEFARLEGIRWTPPDRDDAYLRLPGAKALSPRAKVVLRALYDWREDVARLLDRPPFRVAPSEALVAVAREAPTTPGALQRVAGLPRSIGRRYEDSLLAAVQRGLHEAIGRPTRRGPVMPRPDAETEARLERLKAHRNERAAALGVEPGVLCPNGTLMALARRAPQTRDELASVPELRTWQRQALGEEDLLAAVRPADRAGQ